MAATLQGSIGYSVQSMQYNSGTIANGISQLLSSNFNLTGTSITTGTGAVLSAGSLQCDVWALESVSIANNAHYYFNFSGGNDTNPFGTTLAMTAAKIILVSLPTVDYNLNYIQVGPQNVTNAAQLFFGAVNHTTDFLTVYTPQLFISNQAGWTVSAGSLLPIVNLSGITQTVQIFVAGV